MEKIIYVLKDEVDFEQLKNLGYKELTSEMSGVPYMIDMVFYKEIIQKKNSVPVKFLIDMFNDPKWQSENLEAIKQQGLEFETIYDENGNVKNVLVENRKTINKLKKWRIEINSERWIGFTIGDIYFFNVAFYSKKILDENCSNEIEKLKELNYITEVSVE